jgi:oligosaccharide repeat unit polymerase
MEITILYVLLILSIICGLILTNKHGASITYKDINFASWYFIIEFVFTGAVSVFGIKSISSTNWALKVIPEDNFPLKEVILTLTWCSIAIPIGFLFANKLLIHLKLNDSYDNFKAKLIHPIDNLFFIFWAILIFSFMLYTIFKIGFIPQLKAMNLSTVEISKLRGEITHNFPGSIHLKELIGMYLAQMLSFACFARLIIRKNVQNLILFSIIALSASFFTTLNLSKSGLAFLMIGLALTYSATKVELKLKAVCISALSILITLCLTFVLINKSVSFKGVWDRAVYAQTYGNYLSFYTFPDIHPHIGFSSTSKLIKKLGFEYKEPASRIMMRVSNEKAVKEGTAGFMVSTFFAEAWANWGLVGLIFCPLYVGFFIKFLIGLIINLRKTTVSIGVLVFISYKLGLNMGINKIIFPRYIIVSFILIFITHKALLKIKTYKGN